MIKSISDNIEKREFLDIVGENGNEYNHYGKQYRHSSKN
jgi:hypothetical protein